MLGGDKVRTMCVFPRKMLILVLCFMMIDPPNHHGHLRAANPVVNSWYFAIVFDIVPNLQEARQLLESVIGPETCVAKLGHRLIVLCRCFQS